jgi:hypothetical protein
MFVNVTQTLSFRPEGGTIETTSKAKAMQSIADKAQETQR